MEATATVVRVSRVSFELKTLVVAFTLLLLAFVVLYPIVLLLFYSFIVTKPYEATQFGLSAWRFAISDPGMLKSM